MPTDHILAAVEADALPSSGAELTALAAEYLARTRDSGARRAVPLPADELAALFDEPLPRNGRPLGEVVQRLAREVVPNANWLSHPRYMGHQVSPPLPAAIWCEALISALNNSLAVEEMSPAATAIERRVVRWMADLAGLGPEAGGTLTSGGTEATFSALLAARAAVAPDAWTDGLRTRDLVLVTGEHCHYAVTRAAGQLGIGTRNVVLAPACERRMDPDALARTLDTLDGEGRTVMGVVATAGSTPTGDFDDLDAIGRLCDARGLWLHVDAAHGASALLSDRRRGLLTGIERAQSIAWDPHKMMLLPLPAGVLLVRDERSLDRAFAQKAPYLFHGAGESVSPDQGVRSFQCSRRADGIKLWAALQRYGAVGLGALYDHLCDVTGAMYAELLTRPEFETVHEPQCNILCFRWVGTPPLADGELDARNAEIRQQFNRSGGGWITTTVLGGRRVLRVTVMNPRTTVADTVGVLDELAEIARQLTA